MREDHEPGCCYACGEDKPVRWKNIYTTGSEGTWLCMSCELKVVRFLERLSREAMMNKKAAYALKKRVAEHTAKERQIHHLDT